MPLLLPTFSLAPGNIYCLHIPLGFHDEASALESEIQDIARRQGKSAIICRPAMQARGIRYWLRAQGSAEWLAAAAKISKQEAARVIATLGEPVHEILGRNPWTPCCLLGVAAALQQRPEVLLYSTVALDPLGIAAVHRLIALNNSGLCAIHFSFQSFYGSGEPAPRYCSEKSLCIDLSPN
ncbi:hypothetical protein [Anatilimnocola floriformis]|uniref:hypothetical protein n=1 Tax=Anatilimnocola floriformis TaxID=2948575 RepID=UPI0020C49007|nr:hypothetical protein [Anatilimnocola floriformis]